MITIADILRADHIALQLEEIEPKAAIDRVTQLLKNDGAILNWHSLIEGVHAAAPCMPEPGGGFALCLPHTRGDCVSTMVMSIGRSSQGIPFPGTEFPVRYIFCIAVPKSLAADYLRIVGLLVRIFKDRTCEEALHQATSGAEFLDLLVRREAKL